MSIWEFIKLLLFSRDNPLVRYGGRQGGGGYVLLSVTLFYLVLIGTVWFLASNGVYPLEVFLLMGFTGMSAVWAGVCLALFSPKFYSREILEELWLTRLSQKEVVVGLLRRPFRIALCSFAVPYIVYIIFVISKEDRFDELLSMAIIFPLASLLIGGAVFTRRWLLRSQGGVRYFLLGTLESALYLFFAFIMSLFLMGILNEMFDWSRREIASRIVLWIIPLVFASLKWRQVFRDAPERLFHHIDKEAFLQKNWFAREEEAWSNAGYRKRAIRRQRRFFYPRPRNIISPLVLFLVFVAGASIIGYMLHPSAEDLYRGYHGYDSGSVILSEMSVKNPPTLGVLKGLFGFSGYMGLSIIVPMVIVGGMVGRKRSRHVTLFPGTFLSALIRLFLQVVVFQLCWYLLAEYMLKCFLPQETFLRRMEEFILFLLFQVFLFLPVSTGVFLLLAPSKGRRVWAIVLIVLACVFTFVPLFWMAPYSGLSIFFYSTDSDMIVYLFISFGSLVIYLLAFGFDWLGRRYYRSLGKVD